MPDTSRLAARATCSFVIGQAFRAKYLDAALGYITGHDDVRLTTSDEIAEHYISTSGG